MSDTPKKFGGTIEHWQLHTIVAADDAKNMKRVRAEYPNIMTEGAFILTGTVVEDPLGRWEPGFMMRSSLVLNVDRENGIIETANTIYKIQNEGDGYTVGDMGTAALGIFF